jgi:putative protease
VLVRTAALLDAAIAARPSSITLDYLDLYGLKPSVERVKQAGVTAVVASPRVLKPGEEKIAAFLMRLEVPVLVRSAGLIGMLPGRELIGDFSLNAANYVTADLLLATGLARLAPSYDLNAAQVAALARATGGYRLEAIAYSHLPVFHTEHCVFCRFMSTGTSYKDCGRPCESHTLALRDSGNRAHPVMADVGCRNTVFGAEAQDASAHLPAWLDAGIRHFRLEFVHETPEQVAGVIRSFRETLAGKRTPVWLARELKNIVREGTTQGSLFVPRGYMELPILQ